MIALLIALVLLTLAGMLQQCTNREQREGGAIGAAAQFQSGAITR
ncbi:hypothetical protein [Microbulbifer aestuariivivens]